MNTSQSAKNRAEIPLFQRIVTLILFVIAFIPDLNSSTIIWWGSAGAFIFIFMLYGRNSDVVITNSYFFLKLCFVVWALLGMFYIKDSSLIWNYVKVASMQTIILFLLMSNIDSKEKLEKLMTLFIIAAVIMCIYILGVIDWSALGKIAIGEYTLGGSWNANIIGGITSTAALMAMSKISQKHEKKYYGIYILLTIITILTASRKATVCLLAGTVMITCMYNMSKTLGTKIVKLGIVALTIYFIVTYIPFFYNLVGIRLESLIYGVLGKKELDYSSIVRFQMIKDGFKMFLKKPLIGYGIDSFQLYSYEFVRRSTYAHNNYIELLFDTGIIGFIIYYALYVEIIYRLLKNISLQENRIYLILIMLFAVMEIGMVSYSSLYCQIILLMCYCATKVHINSKECNKQKVYGQMSLNCSI